MIINAENYASYHVLQSLTLFFICNEKNNENKTVGLGYNNYKVWACYRLKK